MYMTVAAADRPVASCGRKKTVNSGACELTHRPHAGSPERVKKVPGAALEG
ncbi:hypothetical protein SXANM310S_05542 [Streptomyces xanthochromogenes]